jgi:hypothetical protein
MPPAFYFDSLCQQHIIFTVGVNSISIWPLISTGYYVDILCQQHITLTDCVHSILFGQFVTTANYVESWCQLHITLTFCLDSIFFWQLASTIPVHCFASWCQTAFYWFCQQQIIFTVGDNFIFSRQLVSTAYYFYSWCQKHFIMTV